jgi:hypothetical protein
MSQSHRLIEVKSETPRTLRNGRESFPLVRADDAVVGCDTI